MTKQIITTCLLCVMIILISTATLRAGEVIRVATVEYPPFIASDLEHYGVPGQIVTEAFQLEGIGVEYGFFPGKRAYNLASNGVYGG